jgi:hypothetical protein
VTIFRIMWIKKDKILSRCLEDDVVEGSLAAGTLATASFAERDFDAEIK